MHFHSLAIFAFAACATFASASPTPSSLELVAARASDKLALAMRDVALAASLAAPLAAPAAPSVHATPSTPAAPALPAPSKVLRDMMDKLTPIVNILKAAGKTKPKEAEIVGYLNNVVAILTAAYGELYAIAKDRARVAITSSLEIFIIWTTLGPIFQIIFPVLGLVFADTPLGPVVQPLLPLMAKLFESLLGMGRFDWYGPDGQYQF